MGLLLELGGLYTVKFPGALEVMPPPPVGPDEGGAAPKSPIAGDLDEELTLTAPAVPGLVGCNEREGPAEQPSVVADDLQVSGRDVGLEFVVVHLDPRHGQVPAHGRLRRAGGELQQLHGVLVVFGNGHMRAADVPQHVGAGFRQQLGIAVEPFGQRCH